ncbi:MAG TPA: YbjN domain-containing protein [Rhizomicrobium sp.]|nr:YbjN domain-containing protein [Rhizomicrobium sp.]
MRIFIAIAVLLVGIACTATAKAAAIPSTGLTREQVMNWLQTRGYKVSLQQDQVSHDNYLQTASQGVNWGIYFFACDKDGYCPSLQFATSWDNTGLTTDQVNTWDRSKRFIRAYNDVHGATFGEYDVDIAPGGSYEQLNFALDRWEAQLTNFKNFINTGRTPNN